MYTLKILRNFGEALQSEQDSEGNDEGCVAELVADKPLVPEFVVRFGTLELDAITEIALKAGYGYMLVAQMDREVRERISVLEDQNQSLETERDSLQRKNMNLGVKYLECQHFLEISERCTQSAKDDLETERRQHNDDTVRLTEALGTISDLRQELEAQKRVNTDLLAKDARPIHVEAELGDRILTAQVLDLQQRLDAATAANTRWRDLVVECSNRVRVLQTGRTDGQGTSDLRENLGVIPGSPEDEFLELVDRVHSGLLPEFSQILSRQLDAAQQNLDISTAHAAGLENEIREVREQYKKLEDDLAEVRKSRDRANASLADAWISCGHRASEISRLTSDLEAAGALIAELQRRLTVDTTDEDVMAGLHAGKAYADERLKLLSRIGVLEHDLEARTQSLKECESKLEAVRRSHDQVMAALNTSERKCDEALELLEDASDRIKAHETVLENTRRSHEMVEKSLDNYKSRLTHAQDGLHECQVQNEGLTRDLAGARRLITKLRTGGMPVGDVSAPVHPDFMKASRDRIEALEHEIQAQATRHEIQRAREVLELERRIYGLQHDFATACTLGLALVERGVITRADYRTYFDARAFDNWLNRPGATPEQE